MQVVAEQNTFLDLYFFELDNVSWRAVRINMTDLLHSFENLHNISLYDCAIIYSAPYYEH